MNVNFSFVAIMKDEINTLPRLFDSIQWLLDLGVDFSILDTGSSDGSVEYARSRGAKVIEVGSLFLEIIEEYTAECINKKFAYDEGKNVVSTNQKTFNFADARNHIVNYANHDFIFTLDCDEAYSKFDIESIIKYIDEGFDQFEYEFVYAHDAYGNPAVQFIQSKAYNRKKKHWIGRIHEVLTDTNGAVNIKYLPESIIKLEHWQEQGKEHRSNYLPGLALDCYLNPDKDRNSHYFARELMWSGMPKSAIVEFQRHIKMDKWAAEKAQSMIFIGDCYGALKNDKEQLSYYRLAFDTDPHRRESLIKSAFVYKNQSRWQEVAVMAAGSLEINWNSYYANDKAMYEHLPHELLYEANGWMGKIDRSQYHLLQCLKYQPMNPKYLHDTRYFFEYPSSMIDGWMSFEEETFLYNIAKKYNGGNIAEIGSFKGRSTKALLTGNKDGTINAIDTWKGSVDPNDDTGRIYKEEDVFSKFIENTKGHSNLNIIKSDGTLAAKTFENNSLDVVFIDAEHTEEAVYNDIQSWMPKVKKGGVLCGHDYKQGVWMTVIEGVNRAIGKPDEVIDTIWVKYL